MNPKSWNFFFRTFRESCRECCTSWYPWWWPAPCWTPRWAAQNSWRELFKIASHNSWSFFQRGKLHVRIVITRCFRIWSQLNKTYSNPFKQSKHCVLYYGREILFLFYKVQRSMYYPFGEHNSSREAGESGGLEKTSTRYCRSLRLSLINRLKFSSPRPDVQPSKEDQGPNTRFSSVSREKILLLLHYFF